MHDMIIRRERVVQTPNWQKWMPYAVISLLVVAVIVIGVLSYDQVDKMIERRLGEMGSQSQAVDQRIANFLQGNENEPPPGGDRGMILPYLPFLFFPRRRRYST